MRERNAWCRWITRSYVSRLEPVSDVRLGQCANTAAHSRAHLLLLSGHYSCKLHACRPLNETTRSGSSIEWLWSGSIPAVWRLWKISSQKCPCVKRWQSIIWAVRIIFLLIRKCFSVDAVKHNTSCLFTLKLHVMIRCTLNVYAPICGYWC